MIQLDKPGVQLSGSFNTSSTNSFIRWALALLVGARWAITMGDDCIEEYIADAPEKYKKYGHPMKNYDQCGHSADNGFEFCSTRFTLDKFYPADGTKSLYRLLEQKIVTPVLVSQFILEMKDHPRLDEFLGVVRDLRNGFS